MKKFVMMAACVALAACGSNETAEVEPVDTTVAADPATATGDMSGTYEVKMADGSVVMQTVNPDGTYVDMTNGTETERGTWRAEGDKMCFDPTGDGAEACYSATAPGADGTFTTIGPDGMETGSTVRKIEVDAGNQMMPAE
ncbi:hypothetical protein [Qipengyuania marisflavi]|uniref:Uncharacterized protein n=1 Tax=Qipengyuania marisflavi TaxID=2486356 RepID=A0A5S3P9J5_9SPHN|nr:hypothetical protein [Qipengyuania marisflavi]TMM50003.1 hypothetical protein FEV51_02040 [Qipengyuania marisflavi]